MIRGKGFMIILGGFLLFSSNSAVADTIELNDGRVIKTDCYWEENGNVHYQKHGGVVSLSKGQIRTITDESGPYPIIAYRAENDEKVNALLRSKNEGNTSTMSEAIIESRLKTTQQIVQSRLKADGSKRNSFERNESRQPACDSYGRAKYDSYSRYIGPGSTVPKKTDPNPSRKIVKGNWRPYYNRQIYRD